MSDERPGLPWLQERYGPESRAAALAARKAKHPDWNWGAFRTDRGTVHVHPGAPDHRILRDPSVAIGAHGAFRVEQKDPNSTTGWRTAHRTAGLPTAKTLVEKKAGIKDSQPAHAKVGAEEMKRRRTHAATMNRLAGTSGLPDRGPIRPVGGIYW